MFCKSCGAPTVTKLTESRPPMPFRILVVYYADKFGIVITAIGIISSVLFMAAFALFFAPFYYVIIDGVQAGHFTGMHFATVSPPDFISSHYQSIYEQVYHFEDSGLLTFILIPLLAVFSGIIGGFFPNYAGRGWCAFAGLLAALFLYGWYTSTKVPGGLVCSANIRPDSGIYTPEEVVTLKYLLVSAPGLIYAFLISGAAGIFNLVTMIVMKVKSNREANTPSQHHGQPGYPQNPPPNT